MNSNVYIENIKNPQVKNVFILYIDYNYLVL